MMNHKKKTIVLILLLAGGLWFVAPAFWDLWGPDESRYVQVAKEFLRSPNWFVMRLNGEFYQDKPPLPFWFLAGSLALTGGEVKSLMCRIPSILMGVAILFFTYGLGCRMFSRRTGLMAALVLLTSPLFWEEVPSARLDIPLTFWAMLAVWIYVAARRPGEAFPLWAVVVFWLAAAGGVLTKGPVVLVFLLSFLCGMKLSAAGARPFRDVRLLYGLFFLAAILVGWMYKESLIITPKAVEKQALGETIRRVFSPSLHKGPPWYYIESLTIGVFPWSVAIGAGAYMLIRKRAFRQQNAVRILPLMVWFGAPFIFFSILGAKREQYLLPVYPALTLFAGWFLSEAVWEWKVSRWVGRSAAALVALASICIAALALIVVFRPDLAAKFQVTIGTWSLLGLLVCAVGIFLCALTLWNVTAWGVFFRRLMVMAYIAALLTLWIVFPALNERKSPRAFCLYLQGLPERKGGPVGVLKGDIKAIYQVYGNYLLQSVIPDIKPGEKAFDTAGLPPVIMSRDKYWSQYGDMFKKLGYRPTREFHIGWEVLQVCVRRE